MAFNTSISGLQAAQKDMGVISNNIANVGTVGFKRGDSLFAELYTAALSGSNTQPGSGVTLERIRADFAQGGFEFTSNQLDLAIEGQGLFVLQNDAETLYTRAGAFRLDSDGFVVSEGGANLQGYAADANGQITTALGNLQITNALLAQKPTEGIVFKGNLDSRATTPTEATFDATDPDSYNFTSTTTVYDSAGAAHQVTMYFVKDDVAGNVYSVNVTIDDVDQAVTYSLDFGTNGQLEDDAVTDLTLTFSPDNAAADQEIVIDFSNITGFGSTSVTSEVSQDGYAAGSLAGFEFDREGIAYATYTNGETRAVGQVALATFTNPGGLQPAGKTNFAKSDKSGDAVVGAPDSGARGVIRPSSLESANVDLTVELLALIEAQRNFQSNAQAIQNANEASQAILQLR